MLTNLTNKKKMIVNKHGLRNSKQYRPYLPREASDRCLFEVSLCRLLGELLVIINSFAPKVGQAYFPIELQKHFQRNAIIVENYYCIANTSVTTKLHVLRYASCGFIFLFYNLQERS